ncbi:MAG: 1,4-dihydroxy-2-naphthoate polyprenyltransferase [Candidatus Nanopelagicales bacterium]|nr:1,4-dihydroxy-2-naphthoate polyprenyltransferase [Candidatus Nanopelagicales bacterium]
MATLGQWVEGSRPRTLPAAIAPVVIGTGLAINADSLRVDRAGLALVVALALQVGVNFANDYSDGIRGTDDERVGPVRLVGQNLARPQTVRLTAFIAFGIACLAGLELVLATQVWWLLIIGVACVAAAWLYTGGPQPYGYHGLGEVFVLIFFGIVPVVGTFYVQSETITLAAVIASIGVGALACAVLVTNNLRDLPSDQEVGKYTLAVRLGDHCTRFLYVACIATAAITTILVAASISWLILLALAILLIAPIRLVLGGAFGPALIPALKQTGLLVLFYGLGLGVLIALA